MLKYVFNTKKLKKILFIYSIYNLISIFLASLVFALHFPRVFCDSLVHRYHIEVTKAMENIAFDGFDGVVLPHDFPEEVKKRADEKKEQIFTVLICLSRIRGDVGQAIKMAIIMNLYEVWPLWLPHYMYLKKQFTCQDSLWEEKFMARVKCVIRSNPHGLKLPLLINIVFRCTLDEIRERVEICKTANEWRVLHLVQSLSLPIGHAKETLARLRILKENNLEQWLHKCPTKASALALVKNIREGHPMLFFPHAVQTPNGLSLVKRIYERFNTPEKAHFCDLRSVLDTGCCLLDLQKQVNVMKMLDNAGWLQFYNSRMTEDFAANMIQLLEEKAGTRGSFSPLLTLEQEREDQQKREIAGQTDRCEGVYYLIRTGKYAQKSTTPHLLQFYQNVYALLKKKDIEYWFWFVVNVVEEYLHYYNDLDGWNLLVIMETLIHDWPQGGLLHFLTETMTLEQATSMRDGYIHLCEHHLGMEVNHSTTFQSARETVRIYKYLDEKNLLQLFRLATDLEHAHTMVNVLDALRANELSLTCWTGASMREEHVARINDNRAATIDCPSYFDPVRSYQDQLDVRRSCTSLMERGKAILCILSSSRTEQIRMVSIINVFIDAGLFSYFCLARWYTKKLESAQRYVQALRSFVDKGLGHLFDQKLTRRDMYRLLSAWEHLASSNMLRHLTRNMTEDYAELLGQVGMYPRIVEHYDPVMTSVDLQRMLDVHDELQSKGQEAKWAPNMPLSVARRLPPAGQIQAPQVCPEVTGAQLDEFCWYHAHGRCRFAGRCRKSHRYCYPYARDLICRLGNRCPYPHLPADKVGLCPDFKSGRGCHRPNCHMRHYTNARERWEGM